MLIPVKVKIRKVKRRTMLYLKNSIGMQIGLMFQKKGFQAALLINLAYAVLTYLYYAVTSVGKEISTIVSSHAAFMLLDTAPFYSVYILLMPFLVVLPFAMSFVTDRSNACLPALQVRSGVITYYVSKAVACFVGGVVAFGIPCIINIIFNQLTFPQNGVTFLGNLYDANYVAGITGTRVMIPTNWAGIWFAKVFVSNPELYNMIITGIFSVAMGIFGVFVYAVSFLCKRNKIVLFLPLYAVLVVLNTFDLFAEKVYPYTRLVIVDYITGNNMYGKNPMFLYTFFVCMGIVIVALLVKQSKKDQM